MKFEEYIQIHKEKIYKKICEYIPNREPKEHYAWVRDYTDRKGKYGRPSYITLWCKLYGGNVNDAILPAACMQASEDWILVHDDWIDGATVRRGKPTLHEIVGDVFAINAGDAMHMINWKMVHNAAKQLGPDRGERFYQYFYEMLLVTAEGQYYDARLTKVKKDIRNFTLEDYYQSIAAKTSYYSVYGPMQFGAIIAGQKGKELDKIKEYGYPLGIAFQMKDDIFDITSTVETFGKSVTNDIYEGVKTAIVWHFVHNANESDLKKVEAIYAKDRENKTPKEVAFVKDLFIKYGSVQFAEQKMEEFGRQAIEKFEENTKNIPENEIKELARDSITYAVKRKK
jgi:geranylgeranyl diphosphate synthase type II